ncbi:MAG TPA: hypothetical protein VFS88_04885 [Micavibrio sp.]|nr:hypothetical protein [Micavibrio sp.]
MKSSFKYILSVAAVAALSSPAFAEVVKTEGAVTSVTKQTSAVAPDGSVVYESQTTVTRAPVKPGQVTFYYYNPELEEIVTGSDLTDDIIALWDTNNNNVIDNHEFYTNAMVVYEPVEYTSRTFKDVDGHLKVTREEYTLRLQQLPSYRNLNKDANEGLTLYEFTGVGFQDADNNNDNQISYDELKNAFYAKEGLAPKPLKENH